MLRQFRCALAPISNRVQDIYGLQQPNGRGNIPKDPLFYVESRKVFEPIIPPQSPGVKAETGGWLWALIDTKVTTYLLLSFLSRHHPIRRLTADSGAPKPTLSPRGQSHNKKSVFSSTRHSSLTDFSNLGIIHLVVSSTLRNGSISSQQILPAT